MRVWELGKNCKLSRHSFILTRLKTKTRGEIWKCPCINIFCILLSVTCNWWSQGREQINPIHNFLPSFFHNKKNFWKNLIFSKYLCRALLFSRRYRRCLSASGYTVKCSIQNHSLLFKAKKATEPGHWGFLPISRITGGSESFLVIDDVPGFDKSARVHVPSRFFFYLTRWTLNDSFRQFTIFSCKKILFLKFNPMQKKYYYFR